MKPTDRDLPPEGIPERRRHPRPGGHGSYKIGGEPATGHRWHEAPPPSPPPSAHYQPPVADARFDDGVPHRSHVPGDDDPMHNEDVAHEHGDINVRAVIMSAVILAVVVGVSQVLMWLLFGVFERQAMANDEAVAAPLARPAAEMPANTASTPVFAPDTVGGPQLLTNEYMALQKHRDTERARLEGFGWVNQGAGVAHIPIDEAKKLLMQRGLPVRAGEAAAPSLGTWLPARGESSGGKAITTTLAESPAQPQATSPAPAQSQQPAHTEQPGTQPKGPSGH